MVKYQYFMKVVFALGGLFFLIRPVIILGVDVFERENRRVFVFIAENVGYFVVLMVFFLVLGRKNGSYRKIAMYADALGYGGEEEEEIGPEYKID